MPVKCYSQGLLGERYAEVGFRMSRPNDPFLRAIDDWESGITVEGNQPLAERVDLNLHLSSTWFGGPMDVGGGTMVDFDAEHTLFEAMLVGHANPYGILDPFAGIGVGYGEIEVAATLGPVSIVDSDGGAILSWVAGVEWELSDSFTVRPQITSGDTIDDFDLDEVAVENLYFTTQFIARFTERVYAGIAIGSDFDDTDVRLEYFLGCGF